jgi:Outer membrane protein beta-barrel domain
VRQTLKLKRIPFLLAIGSLWIMPLQAQKASKDITFDVGAGFSFPLATTAHHTKTGFNFVASGGARLNRRLNLTLDFSLHYFNIKNSLQDPLTGVNLSLGSMMRMWSLTLNPSFEFIQRERFGSYVTAGYGLYNRKLLLAATGQIATLVCDSFFEGCINTFPLKVTGNFSPYKGGYNAGGGMYFGTHTKFFVESRYHHMFTSEPTEVIPLSFGIRW